MWMQRQHAQATRDEDLEAVAVCGKAVCGKKLGRPAMWLTLLHAAGRVLGHTRLPGVG